MSLVLVLPVARRRGREPSARALRVAKYVKRRFEWMDVAVKVREERKQFPRLIKRPVVTVARFVLK